jgi:hypothetical protein
MRHSKLRVASGFQDSQFQYSQRPAARIGSGDENIKSFYGKQD